MNVQLPDGTVLQDVPDGTTKAQIADKLKANGREVPADWLTPKATTGEKVKGALEVGAQLASGAISGPLAGLAGMSQGLADAESGAPPEDRPSAADTVQAIQQHMTYQPQTAEGQRQSAAVAKPFEKLHGVAQNVGEKVTDATGSPLLGTIAHTAIEGAPALIPEAPKVLRAVGAPLREAAAPLAGRIAARGEEATAIKAAEEAPKNTAIVRARSIGLKLDPTEAGGPVGKVLAGAGGKVQTEISLSRANAKVINRTAAKEIGLTDKQSMTPGNLDRLKQKAFGVYDRVRKSGRIASDDIFKTELEGVKERTAQAQVDYPEDTNELIDKEIAKFNRPSADAGSMLEKIKSLRERASQNMKGDADKFELGLAQKKIATAMENLIERQVKDPALIKDFRAARQQLAKIYNVEDALGPSGNLSAAVLARQLKRGVPLSGGLKTLAESYTEFPRVMRSVDALGGHAPFSALDYLVGGVEAVAAPHKATAIVGALAARPLARGIIKSRAYQRAAIKPREPKPSLTTRAARRIAGPTVSDVEPTAPATLQDLR
jgi:hypothetical protein